jgi:RNA polymerase primary sigma factor
LLNTGRRKRSGEILSMLLEKADVQGYLTTDDLVEVYPDVSQDAVHLENILVALRRRGVELYDQVDAEIQEDEPITGGDMDPYSNLEPISSDDTISLYLKEMSRVPLLNVEEEQSLAKRIELGRAARNLSQEASCNPGDPGGRRHFGTRAPDQSQYAPCGIHCQTIYRTGGAIP